MVTITNPNATGVGSLGVDTRFARAGTQAPAREERNVLSLGDRVELGDAAGWRAARESVRAGLEEVRTALSIGQETQSFLAKLQDAESDADKDALIQDFAARLEQALAGGSRLIAGEDVSVQAEPGANPLTIGGLDLRLGGALLSADPDPLASLPALQMGLDRLSEARRALEAHQGFLGAAESAAGGDLDADAARLLALQVRQGLDASGGAIANVEPQAVLSLFRV